MVPDGAPTVDTKRKQALFPRELTTKKVRIKKKTTASKFIRLVEVDKKTDKVLAYKVICLE